MSLDSNRLLMEIDHVLRKVNAEEINPLFPALSLSGLEPVLGMVARARAAYLKALFELSGKAESNLPSHEQIDELHRHRVMFEELMSGAQALQTAIERGYLEVQGR